MINFVKFSVFNWGLWCRNSGTVLNIDKVSDEIFPLHCQSFVKKYCNFSYKLAQCYLSSLKTQVLHNQRIKNINKVCKAQNKKRTSQRRDRILALVGLLEKSHQFSTKLEDIFCDIYSGKPTHIGIEKKCTVINTKIFLLEFTVLPFTWLTILTTGDNNLESRQTVGKL